MQLILPWRQKTFPVAWQQEFGNDHPLHLEVGFGDGRFTLRRALEQANENFVALEISTTSISRLLHKLRKAKLSNVRILKLGAQFAVKHLFAAGSLESITVNFPDPWPKDKHVDHRLLQRSFYYVAANRLRTGGTIRLATDHPEYLAFAREEAKASKVFTLRDEVAPEAVFATKYALKWKAQGKPLYYQVFVSQGSDAPTTTVQPLKYAPRAFNRTVTQERELYKASRALRRWLRHRSRAIAKFGYRCRRRRSRTHDKRTLAFSRDGGRA
jgi:tRNA (guanine-N7-)-methyltransferase